MANLGRFYLTLRDATGAPITDSGAQVAILRQGATVEGAHSIAIGTNVINVDNVGSALIGDSVALNEESGPGFGTITAFPSATQIQIEATTTKSLANGDRLRLRISNITLYNDAQSDDTKANPLVPNAAGLVFAWLPGGFNDVLIVVPGSSNVLLQDVFTGGNSYLEGSFGQAGTDVAFKWDTLRSWTSTAKLWQLNNAGVEKFYVRADGKLPGLNLLGATTVEAGGLTVTAGGVVISASGINVTGASEFNGADLKLRQKLLFGAAGAEDTNLYRNTANELKTDDALSVVGQLHALGELLVDNRIRQLSRFEDIAASTTISITKNNVRLTGASPVTITTVNIDGAAPTSDHDGYRVLLRNVGSANFTLSESGNILVEGASIVLSNGQTVELEWENTQLKWVQLAPKAVH